MTDAPAGGPGSPGSSGVPGLPSVTGAPGPRWAIRRAGLSDLDAIMQLETSTFESDAWSREMMRADLDQVHCHYIVAFEADDTGDVREGAALAGYAGLLSPRRAADADIQTIAVAPDARGRGLGRRLMETQLAVARERGAARVFLEVRRDNPVAQGLYASLGFEPIGVRRGYYQPDNVDAIVMRLDLPPVATVADGGALRAPGAAVEGEGRS